MKLTTAHKITIGTSVAFSALFSVWSFTKYSADGQPEILVFGACTAVASAVLLRYLIRFSRDNQPTRETTQETDDAPPSSS